MSRRLIAALLIVAALVLGIFILVPVLQTVPAAVHTTEHGGSIDLSVDDTTVLTTADCVNAQWHVEGIQAIELDGHGVTGEGSRASCAASVRLEVTFQDGAAQTYTIDKQVRTSSMILRVLMVAAILAFGLGVIISGLPGALWARLRVSSPGRALDARLPRAAVDGRGTSVGVLFAVVAIVLIGAVVRTHYLSRSLRFDESWTYTEFASEAPQFIAVDYRAPNNHIFHTLLVHYSTAVFGVAPWTLRLPVYFAGILVIAATFAAARRFYGLRVGLLAAALTAGASWLVEYSVNARGYALITLVFLLQLCLAWSLRRRSSRVGWIAFALLGAFGLYTVPTMAYPLGIVGIWLGLSILIEQRGRRRWLLLRDMLLAGLLMVALTGLLYLPVYMYIHSATRNFDFSNLVPVSWADFLDSLRGELSKVWLVWNRDLALWVGAALVVGFVASIIFHTRMATFRVSLLAAALLWLPAAVFLQMVITYDRLWVFMLPLYLMLASAGLVYLWRLIAPRIRWPQIGAALAVIVAAVGAWGVISSNGVEIQQRDYASGAEAAIQALHAYAPADALVLCAHKCPILQFYGLMHGVEVGPHYEERAPLQPIYVIDSVLDAKIDSKAALRMVNVPSDQFEKPEVFMSEGDTEVFKVDPVDEKSS